MEYDEDEIDIRDYGTDQGRAWRAGQDWLLSYEEWRAIWDSSGHASDRGNTLSDYRLCRINHYEAWELGNVEVVNPQEYRRRSQAEKQKRHNYESTRILTLHEWAAELKAQA